MVDPILSVSHSVQRRALDVNSLVRRIEAHVPYLCRLSGRWTRHAHAFEIWRGDKIDVLTWVGEKPHHGESDEAAHGSRVVVTREAGSGSVKVSRDVGMRAVGGSTGASGVVILEDGKERGLITNVLNVGFVEIVEAFDEIVWTTHQCDQGSHVAWNKTR